ncbi:MAG TPA: MarR family transcriptional regulator [Planctomycetota bacterium]|nr:MarR family transcriptional regulator [Planctomycetota bacterium]
MGKIYSEIKQSKRFAQPEQEAAVALLRTADVLRSRVEAALLPHGVSPEQYNVLRILRGAPQQSLPTLEIASRMIARAPNITRLIDKLVRKELVSRCDHERDRRVVVVQLTAQGLDFVKAVTAAVDDADRGAFEGLTKAQVEMLIGLLDAVRSGAAPPP